MDVANCLDEHSSSSACRIINRITWLGIQQHNHQSYNCSRRVEFSSILLGQIGKLLNKVFVCVSHYIRRVILIADCDFRHMLQKILEPIIIEDVFISPICIIKTGEQASQCFRICTLYTGHGFHDCFANVCRGISDIIPMATIRNHKAVIFRETCVFLIATGSSKCSRIFFVMNI